MAGITIKMNLEDSGSIVKKTNDTKTLNKELEKTSRLASQALSQPKSAAFVAAESQEYGRGRAAVGTGAAARDFANQAQGLGGLVRLYATYAANVFAVTAAFTALSNAMNTTNMVQGLNQLGAASGVALGNLAKQFVEVTGGAISLRESMEATTKAISSGLTQKQFLDLGKVAKGASQALGVDMSDAVSRLTRGITKLEPELLDELGIFTKVGQAAEKYAKSVGKSVTSLTDFERRQAFANAVLAEGTEKFGEINIPTNPYDKLAASLKNVAQSALELVNVALVPVINLLSASPTILTGVLASLTALIVKQALPAIGQYREGLRSAANEAAAVAQSRAEAAKEALEAARKASAASVLAKKDEIAQLRDMQVDEAEANLRAVSRKGISKGVKDILAKPDILSIDDKDLKVLDDLGTKNTKVAETYRSLAQAIRSAKQANEEYIRTEADLVRKANLPPSAFSAAGIAASSAESARQRAASRGIISQGSQDAAVEGLANAFRNLGSNIKEANLTATRAVLTGIAASASIATTALTGLVSAISGWVFVLTAVAAAFTFVLDALSNNVEQQKELSESITKSSDLAKAATNTFNKYGEAMSFAAVSAKSISVANSVEELIDLAKKFKQVEENANLASRSLQLIKSLWGGDQRTKTEEALVSGISSSLKNIVDADVRSQVEKELSSIFETANISASGLSSSIDEMSDDEFAIAMAKAASSLSKAADRGAALSGSISTLKDGFKTLEDDFTALSNTFINSDPASKFATTLIKQANEISNALKDPILRISTLEEISKSASLVKMFPASSQQDILDAAKNFTLLNNNVKAYETQLDSAQTKLNLAVKTLQNPELTKETRDVFIRMKVQAEGEIARATSGIQAANTTLASITRTLDTSLSSAIEKGFEIIQQPLANAIAKAGIDSQKAIASKLPSTAGTVDFIAKLDKAAIDIQIKQITSTYDLITSIDRLRLVEEKRAVNEQLSSTDLTPQRREKLLADLNLIDKKIAQTQGTRFDPKLLTTEERLALAPGQQRDVNLRAQVASLQGQQQVVEIGRVFGRIEADTKRFTESLNLTIDALQRNKQAYQESDEFLLLSKDKQIEAISQFDKAIALNTTIRDRATLEQDLRFAQQAQKLAGRGTLGGLAAQAETQAQAKLQEFDARSTVAAGAAGAKASREAQVALFKQQADLANSVLETEKLRFSVSIDGAKDQLDLERQQLEVRKSMGTVSSADFASQQAVIDKKQAELDLTSKLFDVEKQRESDLIKWTEDYVAVGMQETADLVARKSAIIERSDLETAAAQRKYDATVKQIDLQNSLSERELAYSSAFIATFEKMGDALADFVLTGKGNFKDLINSMLADLLRFELRQSMMNLYSSLGGGTGIISSIFGSSFSAGANIGPASLGVDAISQMPLGYQNFAKGGAFNEGLMHFARGGAFTNEVVNTPTQFKFAQGAGVMGEAGPEAIMPLARDSSGNLGVRANGGGGNVEVVVNNYTTEKAEARETVDSRGNRRIEVVVGEMVASEVTRSNSAVNKSIRGSFATQPNLIRR